MGGRGPPHFYPLLSSSHSVQLVMHSLPPINPQPYRSKKGTKTACPLLTWGSGSFKGRECPSPKGLPQKQRLGDYIHGDSQRYTVSSVCTEQYGWEKLKANKKRRGKTTGNMVSSYRPVIGGSVNDLGQGRTRRIRPGYVSIVMHIDRQHH